ncbi:MAG: mechanosensitive ion channel [Cyclobacteriaceae bacterium]
MNAFQEILSFEIISFGAYRLSIGEIIISIVIALLSKLLLLIVKRSLVKKNLIKSLDKGQSLAYYQITKYLIIVIAIALILEAMGIKVTFLLAGSAALLVGVGLGLQQLFNDLVSGFIILTEQSIKVGDIIEVDGIVAKVKQIGLRTSKVENRHGIFMIIPNSKIVNENVTNWSHNNKITRFSLTVGVAYGSDVDLVAKLLVEATKENEHVDQDNPGIARFLDFGDSALIFELLFWSENRFRIEETKSQLRFSIDRKFRQHNVQIPFPQRDLHIKTPVIVESVKT